MPYYLCNTLVAVNVGVAEILELVLLSGGDVYYFRGPRYHARFASRTVIGSGTRQLRAEKQQTRRDF